MIESWDGGKGRDSKWTADLYLGSQKMIGLRWRLLGKNLSQQNSQLCKAGLWNCWLHIIHARLIKPPICSSEYKFWLLGSGPMNLKSYRIFEAFVCCSLKYFFFWGGGQRQKRNQGLLFSCSFVCSFICTFVHAFVCICVPPSPRFFFSVNFPYYSIGIPYFFFFFQYPYEVVGGWLVGFDTQWWCFRWVRW